MADETPKPAPEGPAAPGGDQAQPQPQAEAPGLIQLVITMDDRGVVQVTGPLGNKHLCYGLLGLARDAIYEHSAKGTKVVDGSQLMTPAMMQELFRRNEQRR